ncbi:MAG: hypothetical protein M0Z77_10045, partial [Thermoplasmatales archaeon]|nr:hypothetical protein [Thermoplasmatales archaeon]
IREQREASYSREGRTEEKRPGSARGSSTILCFYMVRGLLSQCPLGEIPEVHLPSMDEGGLRSLVRYRRLLGEEITGIKNRIHFLLTAYGISIDTSGHIRNERRNGDGKRIGEAQHTG